jgi:hypothetical protein
MLDGPPLLRIEAFEVGGCHWHGMILGMNISLP